MSLPDILTRSVEHFIHTEELEKRLNAERPLRVKLGVDPTRPDLTFGHMVVFNKLRQFQDLGHEVTFLIGSYTSLIGDPSDKDKLRPQLTFQEVMDNAETYSDQAFNILDPEKTAIRFNHEWLEKITFAELIKMASNFTIQQFLTRESFRKRGPSRRPGGSCSSLRWPAGWRRRPRRPS